MAWRFPIWYFFNVVLSKSLRILAFGLSWSPPNSFPCCLSIRLFCYVLLVAISCSKIVLLILHQVVGMYLCYPTQFVGKISFHCFGMFCFVCIVLLSRYLINLPSLSCTFWFISSRCIVIFACVAFSFLFHLVPAVFLCFIILVCYRFLICVSSRIQVLSVYSWF